MSIAMRTSEVKKILRYLNDMRVGTQMRYMILLCFPSTFSYKHLYMVEEDLPLRLTKK